MILNSTQIKKYQEIKKMFLFYFLFFFNFVVPVNTLNFAIFILYHNLFHFNFFLFKEFQHVAWDNSF